MSKDHGGSGARAGNGSLRSRRRVVSAALVLVALAACERAPEPQRAFLLSTPLPAEPDTATFEPMELGAPVSTPEPAAELSLVEDPGPTEEDGSDPYAYPAWKGFDLDCADVGHRVKVTGADPHRLDRDGDGWGCESY